jgi:ribosomal protein S30
LADTDPTQTGGQEEEKTNPRDTLRLQMEDAIAAKVHEAEKPDTAALDVDENGDLQYQRDEKGRFAPKEEEPVAVEADKAPVEVVADAPAPVVVPEVRKVKVKIYGQEEEVDLEKLIEHGKRDYQKDRAADIKLQEAARRLRQIEEYEARVMRAPSQDAPQQDATPQQDAPKETDDERTERIVYNRETLRAREDFDTKFPEIASDQFLMNMAAQLEQQRLDTARALGEPFGDPFKAYREHGETIRKWIKQFQPAQTVVTSEEKAERKRTIVAVPAASAKAPAPKEEKPQTASEIIAEMAAARKAGRPAPIQRSH